MSALTRHCREAAEAYGWGAEVLVTEEGVRSAELHHDLAEYVSGDGERLVFAVGGDGTVRACARDLARSGVPLSIVPRGTANLFAKALGVPSELQQALRAGFAGEERSVDVAFAAGQPFVAMAGIGMDAAVVEATPRLWKDHFGWLGYAVAGVAHLTSPSCEMTVRLDGGDPVSRRAKAVVVCNVGTLPGGFTLLAGASVDDGLLDVGVLEPRGMFGWVSLARLAVAGREGGGHFEHFKAAKVEVSTASPLPRQLDGDLLPRGCGLFVEVQHKALVVRVPRRGGGIAPGKTALRVASS
jgi:diacylglycerol kinase family enzyme